MVDLTDKPYEKAIKEYEEANEDYLNLLRKVESGDFLEEITYRGTISNWKDQWQKLWDGLKESLERRNSLLREAEMLMRAEVGIGPGEFRGPDARAKILEAGPFVAISMTKRFFNPESLFSLLEKKNLLTRLKALKGVNKEGKEYMLVSQKWEIDYQKVLQWLKENDLQEVITGSYDEYEMTPQVKGPKEIAFIGDKRTSR